MLAEGAGRGGDDENVIMLALLIEGIAGVDDADERWAIVYACLVRIFSHTEIANAALVEMMRHNRARDWFMPME